MSKRHRKRQPAPKVTARDREIRLARVTIENPDWEPAKDGVGGVPRFEQQEKNTRESAVETLFARKFLGQSQKAAADKFREVWESAGGHYGSIDYTLDRVDGGKSDPVASKLAAQQQLRRCRDLIGRRGYDVIEAVCGEGRALTEISAHKRERLTMADNLRADLDELASLWGMRTRPRST